MSSPSDKLFCTVLTDASWCPHEKVAGWACWIVCNDERYKRFDAFFEKVDTPVEAEIKAILNGLFIARRVFNADRYHVVSDCTQAMAALKGEWPTDKWKLKLLDIIGSASVSYKHVKAHTKATDKRSWVNNWCDFNAKIAMRSMRTIPRGKQGG